MRFFAPLTQRARLLAIGLLFEVTHFSTYKNVLTLISFSTVGNRVALNYIAECDPSIVIQQWKEDHIQPLVHLAFNNNNIDVLDALLETYGLDLNFRNE